MATIVVCPKCYKPVAAPQSAGAASLVRCPMCRGRFSLQEVRAFSPPALKVVSESISDVPFGVEADATFPAMESDLPAPTEAGADLPVGHETASPVAADAPSASGETVTEEWLPPAAGGHAAQHEVAFDAPLPRRSQRRRASGSILSEVMKVVLGGLGGLLIGYAVLIWGFHIDPFGLTKVLPNIVLPEGLKHP